MHPPVTLCIHLSPYTHTHHHMESLITSCTNPLPHAPLIIISHIIFVYSEGISSTIFSLIPTLVSLLRPSKSKCPAVSCHPPTSFTHQYHSPTHHLIQLPITLFTLSSPHSPTHLLIQPPITSLTLSSPHSPTHLLIHPPISSLTLSSPHSPTHLLIHPPITSFTHPQLHSPTHLFINPPISSLTHPSPHTPTHCHIPLPFP